MYHFETLLHKRRKVMLAINRLDRLMDGQDDVSPMRNVLESGHNIKRSVDSDRHFLSLSDNYLVFNLSLKCK